MSCGHSMMSTRKGFLTMIIGDALRNIVKIDWYSFSFHVPSNEGVDEREHMQEVVRVFDNLVTDLGELFSSYGYEVRGGRRPFAWSIATTGVTIYGSSKTAWALCEVAGQGCAKVGGLSGLIGTIEATHNRCTRIDLAMDIYKFEENVVEQFVDAGYSKAFKTASRISSPTGVTQNIGSRKSDRMCRVYQYYPPHPRSSNLRIEIEIKKDKARACAKSLLTNELHDEFMAQVGAYKFQSELLTGSLSENYVAHKSIKGKQTQNGTVLWLIKQCVPAFVRLVNEGVITEPYTFIHDNFLKPLGDNHND